MVTKNKRERTIFLTVFVRIEDRIQQINPYIEVWVSVGPYRSVYD